MDDRTQSNYWWWLLGIMKYAYINKIEYFLPPTKESNLKYLQFIGKNKNASKKIIEKIGIRNRRIAGKNTYSNDLAIKSAKKILRKIDSKSIDFLIYCTQTPDYLIPTNACIIQNKLKLRKDIGAFDINLGCSGYVYSLSIAKSLIISGQAKNILLIKEIAHYNYIIKKAYRDIIYIQELLIKIFQILNYGWLLQYIGVK